ncbi:hypothetical protein ROHU_015011 [Labeo rohita]|uniref:Uncharacterized protein n=1 Tax=Labeo rohita TaxID=84645 RepID=A0A498NRA0_LABRO|nr:hypothetical protein ROHU_015011 [Labeo rohita]
MIRIGLFYFAALCATVICPVKDDERHLIKEGSNLTYNTNVSMDGNQILFTFENQNQMIQEDTVHSSMDCIFCGPYQLRYML